MTRDELAALIDDANTDFAELATDTLSVETPTATYLAQVADVAFGDIDNDFINELVFGGLADFSVARSCNDGDNGNPGSLRYLLVTYDYVSTTLEKSGTAFSSDNDWNVLYPGNCSNSPATRTIRNVFVNVLNFDSYRDAEIQANQFIFSGLPEHGWDWAQRADFTLPQTVLMSDENTDLVFDSSSNSIVIDDIDGNGFDDIVTYTGGDSAVRIYSWRESLDPQSGDAIPELFQSGFIAVETSDPNLGTIAGTRINPILVRFDGDGVNEGDVQTLQFVDHVFTLTEPVVLAAIAAPPCTNEPWQNREACTSSWGRAETSGTALSWTRAQKSSAFRPSWPCRRSWASIAARRTR